LDVRNNAANDGFSCPYTIGLRQEAQVDTVLTCTAFDVNLVLGIISDGSNRLALLDTFPVGFEVLEVLENPFGGTVSGLGTNALSIEGMAAPNGFDTIRLRVVATDAVLPGPYTFQASLRDQNMTATGYNFALIQSDYVPSPAQNDPSPVFVRTLADEEPLMDYRICEGESVTINPFSTALDEVLTFRWSTGAINPFITVDEPGQFQLMVTNACLVDTLSFLVSSGDNTVDVGPDRSLTLGEEQMLEVAVSGSAAVNSIRWTTSDTSILSCTNCFSPRIKPQALLTRIYVSLTTEHGCVATDSLTIFLDRPVYAATAFSPNGDGVNDCFLLQNGASVQIESMLIYDRWGGLVHRSAGGTTNDCTAGWDGLVNGQVASAGLYVWLAVLRYSDGSVDKLSGEVMLLR